MAQKCYIGVFWTNVYWACLSRGRGWTFTMRSQKSLPKTSALLLTMFVMLFKGQPAHAIDQVSIENVAAAMRTLRFLESLSNQGPIAVGMRLPSPWW
jgi:hypothetical protein